MDGPAVDLIARQLFAESAFQRVARCLSAGGIEHLLLKGPHLAATVYDQPWQRDYSDLDVLVRPEVTRRAIDVLRADGFHPAIAAPDEEATWAETYDRTLVAPNGWMVELHSALTPDDLYPVDYDALFRRAVPFTFGKQPARGLGPVDLLLHLVIHAAKSHYRVIERKHIEDIVRVVDHMTIDWATYQARATSLSCRTASWVMFTAANATCGRTAIPVSVLTDVRPSARRERWIRRWLSPETFPLLRHPEWPRDIMRTLLIPAMVDSKRRATRAGARFALRRARSRKEAGLKEEQA